VPSPDEILGGLTRIANERLGVAIGWHVALAILLAVVARADPRPSARAVAMALSLPLASVALFAWAAGNPFNATLFAVATVVTLGIASRIAPGPIPRAPTWATVVGTVMIAFGWVYPHFLEQQPIWLYAFAAPVGLVPCPTLAVVVGVALCCGAFGSRAWATTVGALALFYGGFGALRLGVWIDLVLLAGGVATLFVVASPRARRG
jgi:hypothetical protein